MYFIHFPCKTNFIRQFQFQNLVNYTLTQFCLLYLWCLNSTHNISDWLHRYLKRLKSQNKIFWDTASFFIKAILHEDLHIKSSSLAFNFFLALFPTILFFFTLVAYLPINNLELEVLLFFKSLLPKNAYNLLLETIKDILNNQRSGLLSLGFLMAIYFASNGFHTMLSVFEKYTDGGIKRGYIFKRIRAILLTLVISILVIFSIGLLSAGNFLIAFFQDSFSILPKGTFFISKVVQYSSVLFLVYFIFSFLYFLGSSKEFKWRFFSTGANLATVLSTMSTYLFVLYVANFNSYNKLYGSIGTLMVLMFYIYINCTVLFIGFELNASKSKAKNISKKLKS
ncbi:MAG: ribonuclease BN [Bacteroidetes bacterium MED-G17]|nr:MAG: ribonuclease BN [Bacteroidetes bacterium MED-G17]